MSGNERVNLVESLRLYLIADPEQTEGDFISAVGEAVAGGVSAVQVRAKTLHDGPFFALAQAVKRLCEAEAVPIFVNDRVDVALAIDADGVHIGVDDLPVRVVRSLVGNHMLVGYSPATDDQLAAAIDGGTDYVGLGPVFATGSKLDAGEAIGLEAIRQLTRARELPSVGIGGITAGNAASVIDAGADGVAVISAILRSQDPRRSATQLRQVVDRSVGAR